MRIELRPYQIRLNGLTEKYIVVYEPIVIATVEAQQLSTSGHDTLIDTGSHATYFFTSTHLKQTPATLGGVGSKNSIPAAHAKATISIHGDGKKYSWEANILLTNHQIKAVLGYIGFFEYFNVSINSDTKTVALEPNAQFPGTKENLW